MKKCPHCGRELEEGAAFCVFCGGKLEEQPAPDSFCCPSCGAPQDANAAFCTSCGSKLTGPAEPEDFCCPSCGAPQDANAAFCTSCGSKLTGTAEPEDFCCPSCGAPQDANASFCTSCGSKLTGTAEPEDFCCPSCGAPQDANASFCRNCGAPLRSETFAGVSQDTGVQEIFSSSRSSTGSVGMPPYIPPAPKKKSSTKKILLWTLIPLAAVIVLGVAGYFGYQYYSWQKLLGDAAECLAGNDFGKAEELYGEALDGEPENVTVVLGLAEALLRQEKYEEARELLAGHGVPSGDPDYDRYHDLLNVASFQPQIESIDNEDFPAVTVTVEYEGELQLEKGKVSVTEDGKAQDLTSFSMKDGKLVLTYETEPTDISDEPRKFAVSMETDLCSFVREQRYTTPHLEPVELRLVSADVMQYPLVRAFFRVEDPNTGESLEGLTEEAFTLRERTQGGEYLAREIRTVEPLEGNRGLNIDLVADKSSSISSTDMGKIKRVMQEFVASLHYEVGDKAEILAFDSIVQQMCAYTNDSSLLSNGIANMSTDGSTALYDAVYDGINHAALQGGARCVIAFTDGMDNSSRHGVTEVINYALQMQVPVYIIGVGSEVEEDILSVMAQNTGGRYWFIDDLYDLEEIFDQIYTEQKKLYVIEYESDGSLDAYAPRDLGVEVLGNGYKGEGEMSFQAVPAVEQRTHTSRYEVIKEVLTWEEASQRCQEMGGHLATITSQDEMDQIVSMAESAGLKYLWLGGYTSYDSSGRVFGHWVTGEDFSFQKWSTDEPSRVDQDGTPEWYIMLWNVERLGGWSWNDQRNDPAATVTAMKKDMGFVCEYED